jgi:hypothetical protein
MKSIINLKNLNSKNFLSYKVWRNYHTHPITYPTSMQKPMNPWDNMDPGRSDRLIKDEYDK